MSLVETKYFTPQEAQKTLPLVRQIVNDILNNAYQIKLIAEQHNGKLEENETILDLMHQIDSFMKELEEVGCSYRDWNFKIGLVDFPSIIDGEEVLLCWKSDEEKILYYHSHNEGFAGRMLIPEDYLIN